MKKILIFCGVIAVICLLLSIFAGVLDLPDFGKDNDEGKDTSQNTSTDVGADTGTDTGTGTGTGTTQDPVVEPEAPVVLANYDVGYYVSGHTYDSNDSGSKIELTGFHSDFGYTPSVTLVESFEEGELTKYQTTLNVAKYADYTVVIKFYDAEGGFFASDSEEYKKSMKSYIYTSGEDTYKYVVLQYEDLQSDSLILFLSTNECKVEYYESLYVRIYGDNKTILVHKAHAVAGQASETEITVYDLAAGDRILTDVDTAVSGLGISSSATGTISEVYDDWTTGSYQEIVVQSVSSDGDSLTYGDLASYEEAVEYADRAMIYLSEFSSELIPQV